MEGKIMFETRVITDLEQFKNLREEWNSLLQRSYTNTIFLTWEWLYTWWEVFGNGSELFIITVKNNEGELLGIAPLYIKKAKYYKFPVREMAFIGTGLSDRQDFIVCESNGKIMEELISRINESKNKWDIVLLEQIPNDSPLPSSEIVGKCQPEIENSSLCPYAKINGSWEDYLRSLSKKFRKDIRNKVNNMNRLGKWEFKVELDNVDSWTTVDWMENIEAKSKKQGTEKVFFTEINKEFLKKLCNLCAGERWLDYSTICINGVQAAYLFGFLYNNKYYAYNTAYLEEFDGVSPGKLLLNEKIKWCFEQSERPKEFDFLRGDFYIKSLWSSESRQHVRMVFFNGTAYSKMIRLAVFRARPMIKKVLRKDNKILDNPL
jgi:CelD/BcsL family acetyltransferase involved in cellulose biosynthesis